MAGIPKNFLISSGIVQGQNWPLKIISFRRMKKPVLAPLSNSIVIKLALLTEDAFSFTNLRKHPLSPKNWQTSKFFKLMYRIRFPFSSCSASASISYSRNSVLHFKNSYLDSLKNISGMEMFINGLILYL